MAPEVMKDEVYTNKADIYSFALVLYEMVCTTILLLYQIDLHLDIHPHPSSPFEICRYYQHTYMQLTLEPPYKDVGTFDIMRFVAFDKKRPTLPADIPPDFTSLIEQCWHDDPEQRPTFEQVLPLYRLLIHSNNINIENG